MKKIIILTLIILLTSCSSWFSKTDDDSEDKRYVKYSKGDYLDHYSALDAAFNLNIRRKVFKLSGKSNKYINRLINNIKSNNELFFKKKVKTEIIIIQNPKPLHFSFPDGAIYLSSGLITKYVKHEFLLMSILTYELIRSENKIYRKIILIPTEDLNLNKILSLNKINTDTKIEIHKWAYHILKRTGVDPEIYLTWLQVQNRNSLDFYSMFSDVSEITLEEFAFKNYLITNKSDDLVNPRKVDKKFYGFLRNVGEI
jgi:hypothetical protein